MVVVWGDSTRLDANTVVPCDDSRPTAVDRSKPKRAMT